MSDIREPLRALIVDDDVVDRMSVRRALRAGNFGAELEVEEAQTCDDALSRMAARNFDCVFLDYLLPDGNGLLVVGQARSANVRSPIVVLTGQGDERTAVELMKAGASDYLPKSEASTERIQQIFRNALRLHRAERHARRAERERERALQLERRARDDAEAAQRRLSFLAEASALVSSSLDYETTLENVARICVPSLADWCFVDLLEGDGSYTRMAVAHADPAKADLARRLRRSYGAMPDAPHGISRVIATGRSEVMTETPDWVLVALARDGEHLEMMRELRPQSLMTVPLVARGRTLGAMTLIASGRARYTPHDLHFGEELALRAALAVDNARLFLEVRDAERRARLQLEFTATVAGSLAEGVCAVDRSGTITFANAAAESILRLGTGDVVGRPLSLLVGELPAQRLLEETLTGALLRVDDAVFRRWDGSDAPVSYVASSLLHEGVPAGCVIAFHDITQRKEAQALLEASQRQLAQSEKLSALGTLVSGVAHELRTPLTYLTNNLFLLQTRIDAAARADPSLTPVVEDVARYSQAAMEGVDRINALVKDLRPFANPEGGRRVHAGLHEVVAGAVDLFRATQRGRVDVQADLAPTPALPLERGQVQRVAINLLVNAAEAMPAGGVVRVATRVEGGCAILEVEDHGTGIPPDAEARMFDPFFTTKTEGTGLGLAITRRIVEAHGGKVLYRTTLGAGTTFTIVFPTPSDVLLNPSDVLPTPSVVLPTPSPGAVSAPVSIAPTPPEAAPSPPVEQPPAVLGRP